MVAVRTRLLVGLLLGPPVGRLLGLLAGFLAGFLAAFLAGLLAPSPARAQNAIRFAAMVQFTSGPIERVDAHRAHSRLEFKSPIFEGERFVLEKDGLVKLITRNDCVVAIYGPAQALSPEMEKPWRLKSTATRWICPSGSTETVIINGTSLAIGGAEGGELFIDGDRLLVLGGTVALAGGPAPLGRLVLFKSDGQTWKRDSADLGMIWRFNQSRRPPTESTPLNRPSEAPKPPPVLEPKTTRWIFGPTGGSGQLNFDPDSLSRKGLSTDGARLQFQRRRGSGSLIGFLEYASTEEHGNSCGPNAKCPDVMAHGNFLNLQLGYRLNHDRWWSQFVRVGGGLNKARINLNTSSGTPSSNSDIEYDFYMVSAAYGLDAYYAPSWLGFGGLYAGVDVDVARSLLRGARAVKQEFSNGATAGGTEPQTLTTFNLQLMLGLMLLF